MRTKTRQLIVTLLFSLVLSTSAFAVGEDCTLPVPPGEVDFGVEMDSDGTLASTADLPVPSGEVDFGVEMDSDGTLVCSSAAIGPVLGLPALVVLIGILLLAGVARLRGRPAPVE